MGYNDDYDDQYDVLDEKVYGIDNPTTTSSATYYEDDNAKYDAVKVYNRIVREGEDEEAFWKENQNLNRLPPKHRQEEEKEGQNNSYIGSNKTNTNMKKQQHANKNRMKGHKQSNKNSK